MGDPALLSKATPNPHRNDRDPDCDKRHPSRSFGTHHHPHAHLSAGVLMVRLLRVSLSPPLRPPLRASELGGSAAAGDAVAPSTVPPQPPDVANSQTIEADWRERIGNVPPRRLHGRSLR